MRTVCGTILEAALAAVTVFGDTVEEREKRTDEIAQWLPAAFFAMASTAAAAHLKINATSAVCAILGKRTPRKPDFSGFF